jgi:ribonuclease HIII
MKNLEHQLQVSCIKWFRWNYPHLLIFAIPNGSHRHIAVARKLKAEGVVAGIPDLFIAIPNSEYNGLFVEMKAGKNKTTEIQNEIINKLKSNNYAVEVCYSFDEFTNIINNYLKI